MARYIKGIYNNCAVTVAEFYDVIEKAQLIHNLDNAHAKELGKVLIFAAYLCSTYKSPLDTLSVTAVFDEGKIVVVGKGNNKLKGYIDPLIIKENEYKKGALVVIKGENLKKPYTGTCFFAEGLEDGFVKYFDTSEQNELHLDIEIDIEAKTARAVFAQFLPGASMDNMLECDKIFIENGNEKIAEFYLDNFQKLSETDFDFECDCSTDRIDRAILALGKQEAEAIISEQGKIEIKCEFCQTTYTYYSGDIKRLFEELN